MIEQLDPVDARPLAADHAAARDARRRCSAASRSCCSRSSSSASGTCRCCPATSTAPRRATTACATCARRRRAATSSTATATCSSRTARRRWCRSARAGCPPPSATPRATLGPARRRAARRSPRASAGAPIPIPPPATAAAGGRASSAWRACIGDVAARRSRTAIVSPLAGCRTPTVTIKVGVSVARSATTCSRRQSAFPGDRRRSAASCATTRTTTWRPSCSGRSAQITTDELKRDALQGRHAGHGRRPERPRGALRPLPARRRRLDQRFAVDALGQPEGRGRRAHEPVPGRQLQLDARPRPPAAGERRSRRRSTQPASGTRRRASWRWTRATARSWPWARRRRYDPPTCSPSRSRRRRYERLFGADAGAPLLNRAIASVLSDRLDVQADHRAGRAERRRRSRPTTSIDDTGLHQDRHADQTRCNAGKDAARGRSTSSTRSRGVLRRLLLPARRSGSTTLADQPLQRWARRARPRPPDRASTCRASRRARSPTRRGATRLRREEVRLREAVHHSAGSPTACLRQAPVVGRRRGQPRGRPGRPAGHAAADGGRLLGARQRRHGRRARTSARRSRTPTGATAAARSSPARRARHDRPRVPPGDPRRPARAASAAGGTSADVFAGWTRPLPGLRQDRHRPARSAATARPVVVRRCFVTDRQAPDRRRGDDREGRLRRRGRRARGAH